MEFSIVVPVCNEAGNVLSLLREITRALAGRGGYEVIYIDDGSEDGTAAELHRALAQFPALRILRHRRRCGQSAALLTGIRAARAPWIVTLDGDGQNDPSDIVLFLERLVAELERGGALMLVGYRVRRRDNLVRRWSSYIANAVRSRLLQDGIRDSGCGLKLFPRELFLMLPAFDHMHRFLPALMQRQGARVVSVPVRHRPRVRGESKYGVHNRLWVGLVDMAGVMWLQRRRLGGAVGRDGTLSRFGDGLGVYWLQRRPCTAPVEEERA